MRYPISCSFLLNLYLLTNSQHLAINECIEYGRAVYAQEEAPTMSRFSHTENVSHCGIVSVPLILGGTAASETEFPHMAVIGFQPENSHDARWECGGSLISDQFVLTAAHCTEHRELGKSKLVRFGLTDLTKPETDSMQERLIIDRIRHPNYNRLTKRDDIGLLKLDSPVQFTAYVRPACLNLNKNYNGKVIATGFGKVAFDAIEGSNILMKVAISIYPSSECMGLFKGNDPSSLDNVICAGDIDGGKDTCQGDSGGPLQTVLQNPYCMYSIVGVTSFGKFCGFPHLPAAYTNVANFIPWIESIVWT